MGELWNQQVSQSSALSALSVGYRLMLDLVRDADHMEILKREAETAQRAENLVKQALGMSEDKKLMWENGHEKVAFDLMLAISDFLRIVGSAHPSTLIDLAQRAAAIEQHEQEVQAWLDANPDEEWR